MTANVYRTCQKLPHCVYGGCEHLMLSEVEATEDADTKAELLYRNRQSLIFQLQPQSGTNTAAIPGPSVDAVATDIDMAVRADARRSAPIIAG